MPQWKPEDEALFAELCRRAEQQSREAALRAAPAPPPPPPKGAAGAFAPTPPAAAGGGAPRRVPSQTAPLAARRPTLDQETLLILVGWPFYCAAAPTVSSFGRCFIFCFFSFFAKKRDPRFARK